MHPLLPEIKDILMIPRLVLIKGAGDLATGIAHRLWRSGFDVVMLELPEPLVVRRTVSFATAIYENKIEVESVKAVLCHSTDEIGQYLDEKIIPVIIDPLAESVKALKPPVVIDAIMAKKNTGTFLTDAELVIGIGPGFTAGKDVNFVVETMRGHMLGRVISTGSAVDDTGVPAEIGGYGTERLLRSPIDGTIKPLKEIGNIVKAGETIALVDQAAVKSSIDGIIRGMLYSGLKVKKGLKIGDIDPRGEKVDCHSISDKARAVGGGVLEAILFHYFFIKQSYNIRS